MNKEIQIEKRLLYIRNRLNRFFKNYLEDEIRVQFGKEFSSLYTENEIQIGLTQYLIGLQKVDNIHREIYKEKGYTFEELGIDYRTFALFHEVGHLQTPQSLQDNFLYGKEVKKIEELNLPFKERLLRYTNLKLERNADMWAWSFINQNLVAVKRLERNLNKLFGEINQLTD